MSSVRKGNGSGGSPATGATSRDSDTAAERGGGEIRASGRDGASDKGRPVL